MRGFTYLKDVTTLEHDAELCNGCGTCVEVCPHQVFELADGKAKVVARDLCIECGACALNCDPGAIEVDSGVGCAAGIFAEWWRDRTRSRRAPSCCS